MIKIFNKIRLQMLNENKTKRYIKYALGEVILVVIGILIALQINTWNEGRKASNEETKILTALQSDFKVSKLRIEETIINQENVISHGRLLLETYERQDQKEFEFLDTHLDSLVNLIGYGSAWYRAEPVTGAYNSLISAGKIDLIQNEDLRHLLAQFAADLDAGFEDHEQSMNLLNILDNETSHFFLKTAGKNLRKQINLSPRKIRRLNISEDFF